MADRKRTIECYNCPGRMERGTIPFDFTRRGKGYSVHLDAVPAWVCSSCGEALLERREVEAIEALAKEIESKAAAISGAAA